MQRGVFFIVRCKEPPYSTPKAIKEDALSQKKELVILQVVPKLHVGGVERGTVDVACYLKSKGHTPLVVSAGGKLVHTLQKEGIEHFLFPVHKKNPLSLYHNAKLLSRLIKDYKVDIVHARSRAPAWSAYWACKRMKVPLVTTFHGTYNFGNVIKKKYNAIMTYGRRVIAPSQFIKRHIKENYKKNHCGKISVIPRGVDLNIFDSQKIEEGRLSRLIKRFNLPVDKKIILLPGRITRWKGHQVLLEALLPLKGRDDFICIFLGSVSEKNQSYLHELLDFIEKNGLNQKVRILEEHDDMPAFYKLAHVTVSASTDPEAFGRVMAEAGALGCLVIASDHGGAQEILEQEKTGWLFPPGDAEALSSHLEKVLSMPMDQYSRMSADGVMRIRSHFSNEQMFQKTLRVYRGALKD